jgi:anti-sigma B factor antagonist/stage II sporulation protein AA (anti-sigma F factor antagonist)
MECCTTQEFANVLVVRVHGRIDHTTAKAFENAFLPQLDGCIAAHKKVLFDLSEVPYMSSAGLRVLTVAAKQCRKQNSDIVVAALQPLLQEVFRISRFDTIFKMFQTVQEALEAISPAAASAYGGQ